MADLCEFKASLVYVVSFRMARATSRVQKAFSPLVITDHLGDEG